MTEESQRSSSTSVLPLTNRHPVKRVIPLRGLSGETAAGMMIWSSDETKAEKLGSDFCMIEITRGVESDGDVGLKKKKQQVRLLIRSGYRE